LYRAVVLGAGSRAWEISAVRLKSELSQCEHISRIDLYSSTKIQQELSDFWKSHGDFVLANKRGFGYWLWKPYILLNALESLEPAEQGVLYIDAGCSINLKSPTARARFRDYIEISNNSGGLFFELKGENSHKAYTKKGVLATLGARDLEDKNLLVAGVFFLSNSLEARRFLRNWIELMTKDDYGSLIDPAKDELQEQDFIAHRHDQSLMSIALGDFKFEIKPDETYFSPNWRSQGLNFPIWATRIRSRFPFVSEGLFMKVVRRLERALYQ
jgi:hypothetical protein